MDQTAKRADSQQELGEAFGQTRNSLLPLRLLEIATDLLIEHGRLTLVDRGWIEIHITLQTADHDEPKS